MYYFCVLVGVLVGVLNIVYTCSTFQYVQAVACER